MSLFDSAGYSRDIEKQLAAAKPGIPKKELVEDFFKASVAKLFEVYLLEYSRTTVELDFHNMARNELIVAFKSASLEEGQMTEDQYCTLYNRTLMEIGNCAHSEVGVESFGSDGTGYVRSDGGLYVPQSSRRF